MRRFVFVVIAVLGSLSAFCQTPEQNLEKYWHYRDRLRERFIVVSQNVEEEGVNIPAGDYYNDTLAFSDGNSIMSHYLSLLSTELYLLKINGQDYSTTLAELYYAMLALERLDLYSELHWRKFDHKFRFRNNADSARNLAFLNSLASTPVADQYEPQMSDINGMHLRDDASPAFWNKYKEHFRANIYSSNFYKGWHPLEEISQDVIYHNIEGLALVARLVGTENVAAVPVTFRSKIIPQYLTEKGIMRGDSVDFQLWAGDIIARYITCFQSVKPLRLVFKKNHWVLRNSVTGKKVQQGSGDIGWDTWLFYNYGFVAAAKEFTDKDLRRARGSRAGDWVFRSILTEGFNATIKDAVLRITAPGYNKRKVRITIDVLTAGVYELHILLMKGVAGICNLALAGNNDDYKVRSLACTSNYLGDSTYFTLLDRRRYDPGRTGEPLIYEHFPLISLALFDLEGNFMKYGSPAYNSEKAIYENLLNSAPLCGPSGNCQPNPELYGRNWSETSRCVWPENLRPGKRRRCERIEFNGMDYMMLYNLYMIAFSREQYANGHHKPAPANAVDGSLYKLPNSSDCGCGE